MQLEAGRGENFFFCTCKDDGTKAVQIDVFSSSRNISQHVLSGIELKQILAKAINLLYFLRRVILLDDEENTCHY